MSLAEIASYLGQLPSDVSISALTKIPQRLYEIAVYDNFVPMAEREAAFKLLKSVNQTVENSLSETPDALASFREASAYMEENAKFFGYGSLFWLMRENKVSSDQLVSFVMRREHGHLLKNALHVFGEGTVAKAKPEMVKELIRTRRPAGLPSAVLVLHGLACSRDPATEALFTDDELRALQNAHHDYEKARSVVAALGILPERANALPFVPRLPRADLAKLVFQIVRGEWDHQDDDVETAAYLSSAGDEWVSGFNVSRLLISVHLTLSQVGEIYGHVARDELRADLLQLLPECRDIGLDRLLEEVTAIEHSAYTSPSLGPDLVIFARIVRAGQPEQTEAEFEETKDRWVRGGELLTWHRARFVGRLRFQLRAHTAAAVTRRQSELTDEAMHSVLRGREADFREDWFV